MLGGPREEGPSMDTVFADYLTRADLSKYAVINPNSRTISISSADFAALNKKENAADPTLNPLEPNGKVFFISTRSEALKETEKVTEASAQTEVLPTTGDKGSHAGLLGLGMLLTLFGLSGKHKGKEKN